MDGELNPARQGCLGTGSSLLKHSPAAVLSSLSHSHLLALYSTAPTTTQEQHSHLPSELLWCKKRREEGQEKPKEGLVSGTCCREEGYNAGYEKS